MKREGEVTEALESAASEYLECAGEQGTGPETHSEQRCFYEGFKCGASAYARKRGDSALKAENQLIREVFDEEAWRTLEAYEAISEQQRQAPQSQAPERPTVVCLCGSTRFWREFQRQGLNETMAGRIVLSIGAATGTDDEHFGNLPKDEYDRVKAMLDELHLRKIDLADEVLILDVGGYIGESTRRELEYAKSLGKRVRFLEEEEAVRREIATGIEQADRGELRD